MKEGSRPAPAKDDRRTQKTKKFLAEALKELILEKDYQTLLFIQPH
jgi:hypothetical protein